MRGHDQLHPRGLMQLQDCKAYLLVFLFLLLAPGFDAAAPITPVFQLAAQQYPGYKPLLLQPTTTNSINAAVRSALKQLQQQQPASPAAALLIVLASSSGSSVLTVDNPVLIKDGLSLAITTPAALAAVAAAAVAATQEWATAGTGQTLSAADLLLVECSSSSSNGFLEARGGGDVHLSGLSVQRCPGPAVEVENSRSLTVTHSQLSSNNLQLRLANGGAVLATNLVQVTLSHMSCSHNYALTKGGCLYTTDLTRGLTVGHSSVQYNRKDDPDNGGGGSGIYVENARQLTVSSCNVSHNMAVGTGSNGGGLNAQIVGKMLVQHCVFSNNSAALEGGGLTARDVGELMLRDSNFTSNGPLPPDPAAAAGADPVFTSSGGGLSLVGLKQTATNNINATLERVRFFHNRADSGGGLTATQWGIGHGRLEITDCLFHDNQGSQEAGGVYYNENFGSDVIVRRSSFDLNFGQYGGALSVYDSSMIVEDSNFTNNWATADGGALQLQTNMGAGAGNKLLIVRSAFRNNTSGALGGAIAVDGQAVVIEDSKLTSNRALVGGAGVSVLSASSAVLSSSVFSNNSCDQAGGAVGLRQVEEFKVQDVIVANNKALLGGGFSVDQVRSATLTNVTVQSNTAFFAGGAAVMLQAGQVSWSDSVISSNKASMGGALAVDSSSLALLRVVLNNNTAGDGDAVEVIQQNSVQQFAALVYVSGTAGAALLQRSALTFTACNISGNSADHDAGALLIQQPTRLAVVDSVIEGNRALDGVGGGVVLRGTGKSAAVNLQGCALRGNVAGVGSGGAVLLDSGLGVLDVACQGCQFDNNTAGQDGGGVAATGPTLFGCTDCQATDNTASHSGGWFYCGGCSSTVIKSASSSGNKAAAAGGAVSCQGCADFTSTDCNYTGNAAGAGGAVAVQSAMAVKVSSTIFDQNSATSATDPAVAATGSSKELQLLNQLPPTWQLLFGVGSAASGSVGCSGSDSGGGLCVGSAAEAQLVDLTLTNNTGGTGGAVFASAACGSSGSDVADAADGLRGSSCRVDLVNLTARGNVAREAGGALYSSTPQAISITAAAAAAEQVSEGADLSQRLQQHQQRVLLQQLVNDNSVLEGGYGPGAASFPFALSLMASADSSDSHEVDRPMHAGDKLVVRQQQQHQGGLMMVSHGRRLHQIVGHAGSSSGGSSFKDTLLDLTRNVVNKVSSAEDASLNAGVEFDPTCPALGATVLESMRVAVDSFQIFSLPLFIMDAFGSRVSSGPGSDWLVTLHQPERSGVQLSGAARGRLSSGAVVLDGLTLSASSGNSYNMTAEAAQGQGAGGQPLNTTLLVEVRPCLPGQRAEFANGTSAVTPTGIAISSSSSSEITCKICPAPSFSFTAYGDTTAAAAGTCLACPSRGICVAGLVIPSQGCYQPHPRSASIHACSHTRACSRDINAMQNLQGLQCANRAYLDPADIDARPFTALQCSRGYTGPFCSVCYRPGRNHWVAQQWWQHQLARQQQQRGYTVAGQPPVLVKQWSDFNPHEVFGQSNGRCSRCPHPALAWLGFLLARVLDMILIALLSLVWLSFGWLSQSPAADAYHQLKAGQFKALSLRNSILGTRGSSSSRSVAASGSGGMQIAKRQQQQQQQQQRQQQNSFSAATSVRPVSCPSPMGSGSSFTAYTNGPRTAATAAATSGGKGGISSVNSSSMLPSPFMTMAQTAAYAKPAAPDTSPLLAQRPGSNRLVLTLLTPLSSIMSSRGSGAASAKTSASTAATAANAVSGSLPSSVSNKAPSSSMSRLARGAVGGGGALRRTLTGFYHLSSGPSMRWSAAVSLVHKLPHNSSDDDGNTVIEDDESLQEARLSALLLMAVQHLACLVQVVLDAAQIAAVLLSLDLVYFLPDWAATGLSAVLITQANTWQWMAVDCLVPGESPASAAVVEAVLLLVMPAVYTAVLIPLMSSVKHSAEKLFNKPSCDMQLPVVLVQDKACAISHNTAAGSSSLGSSALAPVHSSKSIHFADSSISLDQSPDAVELSPFAAAVTAARAANSKGTARTSGSNSKDVDCTAAQSKDAAIQYSTHTGTRQQCINRSSFFVNSSTSRIQSVWQGALSCCQTLCSPSKASWTLMTAVAVASMAYSFSFYVNNIVSAFTCMRLADKPTLPGEIHLTGSYWVPDMQLQCWRGPHIAVVVLTLLIGVPALLGYLFLLLVLAWPQREELKSQEEQQESPATPSATPPATPPATPHPAAAIVVPPVTPPPAPAAISAISSTTTPFAAFAAPAAVTTRTAAAAASDCSSVPSLAPSLCPSLAPEGGSLPAASAAFSPALSVQRSLLSQLSSHLSSGDLADQPSLTSVPSQSSSSAVAAVAPILSSTSSTFPPLAVSLDTIDSQFSDHLDSELGPFARAAAAGAGGAAAADTALPPVSEQPTPAAGAAAGAAAFSGSIPRIRPQALNAPRSEPTNWASSSSNPTTLAVQTATAATSWEPSPRSRLVPPGARPGFLESPSGVVVSQSFNLPRASSSGPAVMRRSRSTNSNGNSIHHQPELVQSPSGQWMLQTQFGLVPAGSGLVETPLGLKHTKSGRWLYVPPPTIPGLMPPNMSAAAGLPAESTAGPVHPAVVQPMASLDASGLCAAEASLALSGLSRLIETPSGPVRQPVTAATAGLSTTVQAGTPCATLLSTPPAASSNSGSSSISSSMGTEQYKAVQLLHRCNAAIRAFFLWFVGLPAQMLEPPVRHCQQHWAHPRGVTGERCAGLLVWSDWCWYWIALKEITKLVLVTAAAATAMRAPQVQVLAVLLLVILAAAVSWRVQAGCSTSMNRMQYVAQCWLQLLVLLVLLMTLQGLSADAYGGFVLGLLVLVMVQCGVLLACLVWRCCVTARELSEVGLAVPAAVAMGSSSHSH